MSSVKCGIVGLPNVGKSTLFNALLKKRVALSANYPFATVEPNVGVVAVPDPRLAILADVVKREENMDYLPPIVPAVVEFVDIAGLVKGAHEGAGLGNQFLSYIREVDAIIQVLRDFSDEGVVRAGAVNPQEDRLVVETELGLADLQTLEKLMVAQEKETRAAKEPLENQKLDILNQLKSKLDAGHMLGDYEIGDERLRNWFTRLPFLSLKPTLFVYNVGEESYSDKLRDPSTNAQVIDSEAQTRRGDNIIVICAKLEEELADLSENERLEYLKELGIEQTGLERLIQKAYLLLGLISFLTAGRKEVRAWTIKLGTKAPQAAGVIHTDFEKKFIRAEVVEYDKLIEAGSHVAAKQKGWVRTEGKDYMIQDGDVVEFLIGS